jgi:hypothetical protein
VYRFYSFLDSGERDANAYISSDEFEVIERAIIIDSLRESDPSLGILHWFITGMTSLTNPLRGRQQL